jgi:hypothetical protein
VIMLLLLLLLLLLLRQWPLLTEAWPAPHYTHVGGCTLCLSVEYIISCLPSSSLWPTLAMHRS